MERILGGPLGFSCSALSDYHQLLRPIWEEKRNSTPCYSMSPCSGRLGGTYSRYGRFGVKTCVACAGNWSTDLVSHSLLTALLTLSLHTLNREGELLSVVSFVAWRSAVWAIHCSNTLRSKWLIFVQNLCIMFGPPSFLFTEHQHFFASGINRPAREVDHSFPCGANVKNGWSSATCPALYLTCITRTTYFYIGFWFFILIVYVGGGSCSEN